jgi:replicative DNA helicase
MSKALASDPLQVIKVSLAKQRSGPKGKFKLAFCAATISSESEAVCHVSAG